MQFWYIQNSLHGSFGPNLNICQNSRGAIFVKYLCFQDFLKNVKGQLQAHKTTWNNGAREKIKTVLESPKGLETCGVLYFCVPDTLKNVPFFTGFHSNHIWSWLP